MFNKVGMISLGCPKNRVDTEIMLGHLRQAGYELVGEINDAEIIIINTCGFITSAKEESIAAIFEAVRCKEKGNCRLVLAAGCLAQRYGKELLEEITELDGVMGTTSVTGVVEVINQITSGNRTGDIQQPTGYCPGSGPRVLTTPGYTAYLRIAEGCENRCSYCAIPLIRGSYRSRKIDDIVEEASLLSAQGVRELIVVAQETTRYGMDLYGKLALAELLQRLEKVESCRWIRLMYCYPTSITDELIATMAKSSKICRYIDLPLQHINPRILDMMNRRGSREYIYELINKNPSQHPWC